MSDRVLELAQKRAALISELATVETNLADELKTLTPKVAAEAPKSVKATKPKKTGGRKKEDGSKGPSLKKVVTDLLAKHKDGMQLGEIVGVVTEMIKKGEYASKASNVTAIVSQALNQLKGEKLIQKNAEKKYQLVQTAA
jgi:hypothetical protein